MLYVAYYILYIVCCTVSIVNCMMYIVYCILYIVYCILYIVCCILYIVNCILYIVYCILYIVYCIRVAESAGTGEPGSSIAKDLIDSEDPKHTLFCCETAFVAKLHLSRFTRFFRG